MHYLRQCWYISLTSLHLTRVLNEVIRVAEEEGKHHIQYRGLVVQVWGKTGLRKVKGKRLHERADSDV